MTANELMIMDWVANPINGKPMRVMSLTRDVELGLSGFYDEVDPIPLTAEILEKIGFWLEHNVGYVMEEGEYEIIYDLFDHKLRILKNREQILNLEYWDEMCVHELQHALRLCEIDKEIKI